MSKNLASRLALVIALAAGAAAQRVGVRGAAAEGLDQVTGFEVDKDDSYTPRKLLGDFHKDVAGVAPRRRLGDFDCKFGDVEADCDCPCDQCIYCGGREWDDQTVCKEDIPCGYEGALNVCCAESDFRNDVPSDSATCRRANDKVVYPDAPRCSDSNSWYYVAGDKGVKNCDHVEDARGDKNELKARCGRTGWIGAQTKENEIKANVACPYACGECGKKRDAFCKASGYDIKSDFADDFIYWDGDDTYTCKDIGKSPFVLCSGVGVGGVKAADACSKECDLDDWFMVDKATSANIIGGDEDDCLDDDRQTVDNDDCGEDAQSLLKFDLSKYAGRACEEAKLLLYTDGQGGDVDAYRMTTSWDSTTDWDSLGGGISASDRESKATFTKSSYSGDDQFNEYDVTKDVSAWLSGVPNEGWGFIMQRDDNDGWEYTGARGPSNQRPVLWMKLKGKGTAPKPPKAESSSVKLKRDKCKSGDGDSSKSDWTYDAGGNGIVGCDHVGKDGKAEQRCARIGTGGIPAKDACCETCADYDKCDFDEKKGGGCTFTGSSGKTSSGGGGGTCADGSTGDLSGYYYKKTKGCKNVAKDGLCGKKGKDKNGKKVRGTDVCCKSCVDDDAKTSSGGGGGTCADGSTGDLSGYYYKKTKGCKNVAKEGLCGKKGKDKNGKKVRGSDVCCKSCADGAKTSSGGGGGTCADGSKKDLKDYYYKKTVGCKAVAKAGLCGKKGKDKNGKKVRGSDVCCKSC